MFHISRTCMVLSLLGSNFVHIFTLLHSILPLLCYSSHPDFILIHLQLLQSPFSTWVNNIFIWVCINYYLGLLKNVLHTFLRSNQNSSIFADVLSTHTLLNSLTHTFSLLSHSIQPRHPVSHTLNLWAYRWRRSQLQSYTPAQRHMACDLNKTW